MQKDVHDVGFLYMADVLRGGQGLLDSQFPTRLLSEVVLSLAFSLGLHECCCRSPYRLQELPACSPAGPAPHSRQLSDDRAFPKVKAL